jgi:hypothetical protein
MCDVGSKEDKKVLIGFIEKYLGEKKVLISLPLHQSYFSVLVQHMNSGVYL